MRTRPAHMDTGSFLLRVCICLRWMQPQRRPASTREPRQRSLVSCFVPVSPFYLSVVFLLPLLSLLSLPLCSSIMSAALTPPLPPASLPSLIGCHVNTSMPLLKGMLTHTHTSPSHMGAANYDHIKPAETQLSQLAV